MAFDRGRGAPAVAGTASDRERAGGLESGREDYSPIASGQWTLVISHEGIVYRKDGVLRDLEVFPPDPLKEGWEKMD